MKKLLLLLLLPFLFAFTYPAALTVSKPSGSTYYVNLDAAGGGDGSEGTPWNNMEAADGVVSCGDTVQVWGTWASGDGLVSWDMDCTSGNEVVWEPYSTNTATFQDRVNINGDYCIIDGGSFTSPQIVFDGQDMINYYPIYIYGDNVTLWRVEAKDNGKNNSVSTATNISISSVSVADPADNFKVYNCLISGSKSVGMYLTRTANGEIKNNLIHDNGGTGIQVNPHGAGETVTGLVIAGNFIYSNGAITSRGNIVLTTSPAVATGYVDGVKIYNNLIFDAYLYGIKICEAGSGSFVGGVEIYNNTIYGNTTYGIWNRDQASTGCTGGGACSDPIIRNNIATANGSGQILIATGTVTQSNNDTDGYTFQSVNPASADFLKITASDPGYDTNPPVTVDYFGTTRNASTPDIGYHEYTTTPSAAITGTITTGVIESDIATGGKTLIITLTNDTWDANMGSDHASTTALIAGIVGDLSEAHDWSAEVTIAFGDVTRNSDTQVTIVLPASAGYNITQNERITVTIPTTAVASGTSYVATPSVTIVSVETPAPGGGAGVGPGAIFSTSAPNTVYESSAPDWVY